MGPSRLTVHRKKIKGMKGNEKEDLEGRENERRKKQFTYLLRGLSLQANYTDRATAACR
jgi:hypothetical protein